jgi:hypothetical protein
MDPKDLAITGVELCTAMYLSDTSRLKLDKNGYLNALIGALGFLALKSLERYVRASYRDPQTLASADATASLKQDQQAAAPGVAQSQPNAAVTTFASAEDDAQYNQ